MCDELPKDDVWGDDEDEIPVETEFILGLPSDPLLDSDPLQVSHVSEPSFEEPLLCLPPPSSPPPPDIPKNVNEFTVDMGKKVNVICQEAIYWFNCDPREYHPFYLTIDECIKTGTRLGLVQPSQVNKIWVQFSNFAKQQYQDKHGKGFRGPFSKYADSVVRKKRTKDKKLLRQLRELKKVGEQIRLNGLKSRNGGSLKDDLATRLAFFKECGDMTSPDVCYRMNKLWKEVLSEETEGNNKTTISRLKTSTEKIVGVAPVKQEVLEGDFHGDCLATSVPDTQIPAAPQIPLRKRVKRRKFPIKKLPSQTVTPTHLVTKRKKVALGMRRVITTTRKADTRQRKLERRLNQPKEKLGKIVKAVNKKTLKEKTLPIIQPSVIFSKSSAIKSKTLRKDIAKKKVLKKLKSTMGKTSVGRQKKIENNLNTTQVTGSSLPKPRSRRKPNENPAQIQKEPPQPRMLLPRKSKQNASKRLVEVDSVPVSPEAPPPSDNPPIKSEATSIEDPALNPVEDSSFQEDTVFSPPPASPDNNDDDDLDYVPATEPTPLATEPSSKESAGSPPSPPDAPQPLNLTNKIFQKYHTQKLRCPLLCKKTLFFHNVACHLRQSHNHFEDLWQCPSCPRQFQRRDCWLFHVEAEHNPDQATLSDLLNRAKKGIGIAKPFVNHSSNPDSDQEKCDICDEMFNSSYLATHKKVVHSEDRPKATCPMCPKTFKDIKNLWSHYCTNHAVGSPLESMYPFDITRNEYRSKGKVKEIRKTDDPIQATCDLCGVTFSSVQALSRHQLKIHGIGDATYNQWPCRTCGKTFKAKDTMDAHFKRIHEGSINSKCPHCNRDCQTSGKLWTHMVETHGLSGSAAGSHCNVDWCPCEYCGKEVLVDRQYTNHVKSNHPEYYEAFVANKIHAVRELRRKRVASAKELARGRQRKKERRHIFLETGEGPLWIKLNVADSGTCPECGAQFSAALSEHRRWDHGVKPEDMGLFTCKMADCSKSFRNEVKLMIHMRQVHTVELEERIQEQMVIKVMERKACTEKSKSKERNMAVYQCSLCGDFLYYYEEVKVHCVVRHPEMFSDLWGSDKDQDCKCQHCPASFEKVYQLKKHVLEVHRESCWTCEKCGVATLTVDELDSHWAVEHVQKGEWYKVSKHISNTAIYARLAGVKMSSKDKLKWDSFRTTCEVCGLEKSARHMEKHLNAVHGITEDGEGLVCSKCPVKLVYKYGSRGTWLCHMTTYHKEVSLEELKIEVGRVHTKQHWRKMSVKNSEESTQRRGGAQFRYAIVEKMKREGTIPDSGLNAEKAKWEGMMLTCEICGAKRVAKWYNLHLKGVHGITEDQRGLKCKVCPEDNWFSFQGRTSYMLHMATYHGTDAEELREEMAKIYTKQDWRTMEIKNPQGKHTRKPRKRRASSESQLKRRRRTQKSDLEQPSSTSTRKSSRNVKKTGEYGWDSEEEEEEMESSESGGAEGVREDKFIQPKRMRTRASRKRLKTDNCKGKTEEIEKNRKLVISLARVQDDEILKWKRKRGRVSQEGKQSDYQVKIEVEES